MRTGPARFEDHNGDEDPGQGWFLVWVSAASEKPILIEHDLDVHNWGHLVLKVEGPFKAGGQDAGARFLQDLGLSVAAIHGGVLTGRDCCSA